VDDGIATGASIYAAIHALRPMQPARLVLAIPVAPASTCTWLRNLVEQLVCLYAPVEFHAVGQFYVNFHQVEDEEVIDLLRRAQRPSDDSGDSGASEASGNLSPPDSSEDVPERSSKAIASASASSDRQ
jgi:predicted phosphoribosyltransferase